ncbi:MAG: transposase, partial [Desulfobacteraceae bacterium]|nr:transposase [Desulfobacteraceae bacterium]
AGGQLIKVRPHGTTQVCFRCRKTVPKKLTDRIHNCSHCGFVANRDYNAALNILLFALIKAGLRTVRSVEMAYLPPSVKHQTASM